MIIFLIFFSFFKKIRFGSIRTERIGHLITNKELYLLEKRHKKINNFLDILYRSKFISNIQAYKMIKKKIFMFPPFFVHMHTFFKLLNKNKYEISILKGGGDRDKLGLLKHDSEIDFSDKEYDFGKELLLQKFNCDIDKDKIVFLAARDSAYLEKEYPNNDWHYHDYRNWNINNFVIGCEYLSNIGYKVFRVGKFTNQKIISNNKNVYDYVNSIYRSDFMDLFLAKVCKFAVSTGLGIDSAPLIFRKPIAIIQLPFEFAYFHGSNIVMTKHHYSVRKKKNLSISEIFEEGNKINFKYTSSDYKKIGLTLIENSPEEIRDLMQEMHLKVNNKTFLSVSKEKEILSEFWNIFNFNLKKYGLENYHGNISGNISVSFLKNNPYLLK
jgi:putative glycosyltransferase (TIGR04372 family)